MLRWRLIGKGTDAGEPNERHGMPRPRLAGRMKIGEMQRSRLRGHADKSRWRGRTPLAAVRSATGYGSSSVSRRRGGHVKHTVSDSRPNNSKS